MRSLFTLPKFPHSHGKQLKPVLMLKPVLTLHKHPHTHTVDKTVMFETCQWPRRVKWSVSECVHVCASLYVLECWVCVCVRVVEGVPKEFLRAEGAKQDLTLLPVLSNTHKRTHTNTYRWHLECFCLTAIVSLLVGLTALSLSLFNKALCVQSLVRALMFYNALDKWSL